MILRDEQHVTPGPAYKETLGGTTVHGDRFREEMTEVSREINGTYLLQYVQCRGSCHRCFSVITGSNRPLILL
ncbi:MAG: hypothetical protein ATN35_07300 [Epulopiscium sp. Nele67-Bin004]|nr:MAG: hypothetical protein ATN35_07300 [Epulopiscium sp. Nele67-Bin004]